MSTKKKKKQSEQDVYRLPKWLKAIFIIMIAIVLLMGAAIVAIDVYLKIETGNSIVDDINYAREVVDESTEDTFKSSSGTIYYDVNGDVIGSENASGNGTSSTYLSYSEIPEDVVNAFIAIEDPTFWSNNGTSMSGLGRAFLGYIHIMDTDSGGSTITQQVAKNTFLSQEVSIDRKMKEIFMAMYLTNKYSKQDIMEYYVNQVYFANQVYGIEDAAQTYFGVSASELTLSQTAYLAAIPNRPSYYNPLENSSNAIGRRDRILKAMYENGFITESEYEQAIDETIEIVTTEDAEDETSEDSDTSVSTETQKANATSYLLTYAEDCAEKYFADLYGITEDEASTMLAEGGYRIYTSLDPEVAISAQQAVDDTLSFSTSEDDNGYYLIQGAVTVIDNSNGKVIAVVGGRSQESTSTLYGLNRAFQSYRQPGSSIKPLVVYTPALMKGYEISDFETMVWKSDNTTAQNVFKDITPAYGISFLQKMDFAKIVEEDETLAAALGGLTNGVTTVEMASAYSCLSNSGEFVDPTCLTSVLNTEGEELYEESDSYQVYTADAADDMTEILKGVISEPSGTAYSMDWYESSNIEVAGKTGTTNDNKDGWFCGFSSGYTVTVWVGSDDSKAVSGNAGSTYPASIWKDVMLDLVGGEKEE